MQRIPWMNWLLMLLIAFAFAGQQFAPHVAERFILGIGATGIPESGIFGFMRIREVDESPLSWIGYMFLHGGYMHLLGNLLFMWVFGNAVCSKVGNIVYLVFWIGIGLLAALAHTSTSAAPVLGASGAINGVVGAFLILYPTNSVTMFFFFFLMFFFRLGTFLLSSYWVILMWFAFDVFGLVVGGGSTAYGAHLGGFLGGATFLVILLMLGFCQATEYERNLLEIFAERAGKSVRPDKVRLSTDRPDPAMMGKRLHVILPDGVRKQIAVIEFVRHETQGKPVDHLVVSEDGEHWISFGDWRKSNLK